jgi:GrpB-like predicted nucleotidyltransferase (UPF0157 family)
VGRFCQDHHVAALREKDLQVVSPKSTSIGLQRGIVRLVAYQPAWKALFAAEAERIRDALGERALAIEHVGSTAVAGLPAKPIIDLMVGIADIDDADKEIRALQEIGYERRPNGDLPGRLFLVLGTEEVRRVHLSLSEPGSDFWRGHLQFRDCLRANPALATAYEQLKRDLAARYPDDRLSYTAGKEEFIAEVLAMAEGNRQPTSGREASR